MSIPNDELEKIIQKLNNDNKMVAKNILSWLLDRQLENDDDQLTPDDIVSLLKAREEFEVGKTTSLEDLKRELGI